MVVSVVAAVSGAVGCAQRVAVVSLPMIPSASSAASPSTPREGGDSAGSEGGNVPHVPAKTDQARYWSAFAYIDELSVLKNWGAQKRDNAFVTVRVKLPTRDGVLNRDFPLYTIKGSSIQSHQGVDLLQKFPLSAAAREQVTIVLEIRYLKDAEALETTRTIVANAEKLAQPYLRNFPVASSIMTSAVALTDQLAPKEDEGINTAAFSVNPTNLEGLHGYLLVTDQFKELPSDLVACADKPGTLCTKSDPAGPIKRYDKNVYVTLRFEERDDVYDPLMLLRGSGVCPLIDRRALEAARDYLRTNISLFVDHDVAIAETAFAYAEQYLKLREGVAARNFGGMLDILNEYGNDDGIVRKLFQAGELPLEQFTATQPEGMLYTVSRCYKAFWEQTPGREVLAAWTIVAEKGEPNKPQSAQDRLNALGAVLSRLGAFSGVSDWQADGKNTGIVIELLRGEAQGLIARQLQSVTDALKQKPTCDSAGAKRLLSLFSSECRDCVAEVTEYCVRDPAGGQKITSKDFEREIVKKSDADRASGIQQVQSLTTGSPAPPPVAPVPVPPAIPSDPTK